MPDSKARRGSPAHPEWFTDPDGAFGEEYFETQEVVLTPERTRHEVDFVIAHGEVRPGDAVLDIPCGHGRHAVELARRGFDVTGVDLSPSALGRARAAAERAAVDVRFLEEDMRTVSPEARFDLALNLYNSIGYADEATDREIFRRIAASLKPDGRLIVDISSHEQIVRLHERPEDREGVEYVCESAYRGSLGQPVYNLHIWNPETRRMVVYAIWKDPNGSETWRESVIDMRSYALDELAGLLESTGMRVTDTWGDFDGTEYDQDSSRRLIVKSALA